jgi:hypothetical protein
MPLSFLDVSKSPCDAVAIPGEPGCWGSWVQGPAARVTV